MRLLSCGLLLVLISQVLQLTCAQAAKPLSSVDHSELPPWKADGNLHLGVQGLESPKLDSANQLILHFSQLVKSGQIKEARQFLAEHKESLANNKSAFLLSSIYLNAIRFGSLDLVESLISSGMRPPTAAMRVSLLKYALWKRESAIAAKLRASDFETDQFADVALGSIDRLKLALREPAAAHKRDENGCTFVPLCIGRR
ncbi:MAG: hypothetical protein Q8T09_10355 [Candidatus Melainabacteria bacterium]|nr:hypothetical protein [Candidatus Melainabacteria bacterium]